ncbi:MAG: hypothetical protein U0794_02920 [Isosphaeraceae bacterium]
MKFTVDRRCRQGWSVPWVIGFGVVLLRLMGTPVFAGVSGSTDPAQVVPLAQIAPEHRESVAEVIREHTLHRKGAPETFPCNPRVYLTLLNEPVLTLALWQDLAASNVKLRQVGPNRYEGTDGAGASAVWEFVYRSPKLHVLLADLDYTTPRGAAHLDARIVLVVHSGFYREVNGEHWVQHDVEAFVKVDSKGWKAVARTVRPVVERLLEDQVREAGWFVSLMGRLVATHPNWACQVALSQPALAAETRQQFQEIVQQTRRPGAFAGRPTVAENAPSNPNTRTR